MEDTFSYILFLVFIGGVLVLAVSLVFYYQMLRRREFLRTAAELRLRYYYRSYAIPRRFAFLRQHRRGRGRHAFNILYGRYQDDEVFVFDFKFNTGIGKEKKWHQCSFFVMRHPRTCPPLRIYPRAMLSVLGQIVGYEEIHLENEGFHELFSVYAADESFARALFTQPVADYLLRHPELSLEVESDWIALGRQDRLVPEEIPHRLHQLQKVRRMLAL